MAVLPAFPGLEVTIVVNGQPLPEYADPNEEATSDSKVVRYIPVESGTYFAFHIRLSPSCPLRCQDMAAWATANGGDVSGRILFAKRMSANKTLDFSTIIEGVDTKDTGVWIQSKLQFAQLTTVEYAPDLTLESMSALGKLELKLCRVHNIGPSTDPGMGTRLETADNVAEKALKGRAVSHTVRSGEAKVIPNPNYMACDYIDTRDNPMAVFVFNYCSLDALKSQLIIPRSPSPIPLEERPIETLSLEEARELLARQKKKQTVRVKREPGLKPEMQEIESDDGDDSDDLEVTEMRPLKARKTRSVVDLTDQ